MTENQNPDQSSTESTPSNTRRDVLRAAGASPVALVPGLSLKNTGKVRAIEVRTGYLPHKDIISDDLSYPVGLGCSQPSYHLTEQGLYVTSFASEREADIANNQETVVITEQVQEPTAELWGGKERALSLFPDLGIRTANNLHVEQPIEKPTVSLQTAGSAPSVAINSIQKSVDKKEGVVQNLTPISVHVTAENRRLDPDFDGDPKTDSPVTVEEVEKEIDLTPVVKVKNHGRVDMIERPPK